MEYTRWQTDAKYDGLMEGEAKGFAKGFAEGRATIVQNMIHSGLSIEQIAEWTRLSVEEVRALRQKTLS